MGNKGLTDTGRHIFGSNTIKVADNLKENAIVWPFLGKWIFHPPKGNRFGDDLKRIVDQKTLAPLLLHCVLTKHPLGLCTLFMNNIF